VLGQGGTAENIKTGKKAPQKALAEQEIAEPLPNAFAPEPIFANVSNIQTSRKRGHRSDELGVGDENTLLPKRRRLSPNNPPQGSFQDATSSRHSQQSPSILGHNASDMDFPGQIPYSSMLPPNFSITNQEQSAHANLSAEIAPNQQIQTRPRSQHARNRPDLGNLLHPLNLSDRGSSSGQTGNSRPIRAPSGHYGPQVRQLAQEQSSYTPYIPPLRPVNPGVSGQIQGFVTSSGPHQFYSTPASSVNPAHFNLERVLSPVHQNPPFGNLFTGQTAGSIDPRLTITNPVWQGSTSGYVIPQGDSSINDHHLSQQDYFTNYSSAATGGLTYPSQSGTENEQTLGEYGNMSSAQDEQRDSSMDPLHDRET
jgi:hypothetical protein